VIITDVSIPRNIEPVRVHKSLETETPFDLVLLMSKYGLKFSELQFMSKLDGREVTFAEKWLTDIGAIEQRTSKITDKGLLMSEIPYEPDFAHMISDALISGDYDIASFLLACGAFGDSLNHAYRTDMEGVAKDFLYTFDRSNELNVKAHLLRGYSGDTAGTFIPWLTSNGIFPTFVEEAWRNFESARDSLNDILSSSGRQKMPAEVVTDPDLFRLRSYLEGSLSFEVFELYQKGEYGLRDMVIEGQFFARTLTINNRRILFDIVAMNRPRKHHRRGRR
jgi:HrpA-like RNA helicase